MGRTDIAVIIIGRNEGARLDRCLASCAGLRGVYVDSGSVDGSPDRARAAGVEVIELDRSTGFSAARGRNAGLDRLIADPAIAYIQMLDGDSILAAGWTDCGATAFDADSGLGAVFGELREAEPDRSLYAWLSDVEWAVPPGPAALFSGNVMLRADAVRATGRYRGEMIAGEDPEFAIRMRAAGWRILCLDQPMATHQGAVSHARAWWRRTRRAGHAFAALTALHPGSPLHDFGRSRARILFWGGAIPFAALGGLMFAALIDRRWIALTVTALLLVAAQLVRVTRREMRRHGLRRAVALALSLTIGKYAEMAGLLRFHLGRRP